MNSNQIHHALEAIKATPGKNDKIEMLKCALEHHNFLWAVTQMLDPRLRFGVAKKTLDQIEKSVTQNPDANFAFLEDNALAVHVPVMLASMAEGSLTGAAAKSRLEVCLRDLNWESWCVLRRILEKKPDGGFTASSVNKARPKTIWTFDCMLAHPFEEKRVKSWPVAVEPKIDGVRCLIMIKPATGDTYDIGFFSRTGKEYTTFNHLKAPLTEILNDDHCEDIGEGLIVDCEIDSGTFNDTVSQARKKEGAALDAVARIFDIIPFEVWEGRVKGASYTARRSAMTSIFGATSNPVHEKFRVVPVVLARSVEQVQEINADNFAAGLEGSIVKPLDHRYERKRSHSWAKIKGFETHDLIITGMFEGQRKYAGQMGGVICELDGVEVRVGGGWSDDDRKIMWNNQQNYIGRMIEVGAHEKTPDGSLRHPRFMRWRSDKYDHDAAAIEAA